MGVNDVPSAEDVHSAYALDDAPVTENQQQSQPTPGIGGERVIQPLSQPEPVVQASAYSAAPVMPAPAPNPGPVDLGLPLPPPIPDFSQVNGAPALPLQPAVQPAILGDILAPEPPIFDTSNAVAAPNTAYAFEEPAPALPPLAPEVSPAPQNGPADPTQFQIPPSQ